jgi:hypothetical protein
MNDLRLQIQIHNRYQVLDASGQLPFSIVFGLCRKSPTDTDHRSIVLETAGSVFDVPYALTHGLLTLHERDEHAAQWVKVDLSPMGDVDAKEPESITVPSPVGRTTPWKVNLTEYLYPLSLQGALASVLKVGKRYRMKLASQNLGVKKWAYGDDLPGEDTREVKLVSNRAGGNGSATFKVVKDLAWPPKVETRMRLCTASPSAAPASSEVDDKTALEVSVVNTGSEIISVQTRGHHKILVPYGPMGPDLTNDPDSCPDDLPRIIGAETHKTPIWSLTVVDVATGEVVVRGTSKRRGCRMPAPMDQRPKVDDLVTLEPGIPVTRIVDIGLRVKFLKDGQYKIRMHPTGCRWWQGKIEKEEGGNERVPVRLCKPWIVPLMLETEDEVEVRVKDGKVVICT